MLQTQSSNDELQDMISAELSKLMSQIHNGTAEGRWVLHGQPESDAIAEFSRFFMQELWVTAINQDRARIAGNRFAMIQNTCEFLVKGMKATV
jgi:CRISPR-associated protein Csc3